MSAHTPGPWRLFQALDARPHSVFLRQGIGSIEVPHYGYIDPDKSIAAEQLCNARLIAAAPELLEALKAMSALYAFAWDRVDGGLMMMNSGVERFEAAHALAQDAIAKATQP